MGENLILIPFAYEKGKNSGKNLDQEGTKRLEIYLKNALTAAASARQYNPADRVLFVCNLSRQELPEWFVRGLEQAGGEIRTLEYDRFIFPRDYPWSLAYYKLNALSHLAQEAAGCVCYLDVDVVVQSSFEYIWQECSQHILLYDINHAAWVGDYQQLCRDAEGILGERALVTHYGGEFFAASAQNARAFADQALQIYQAMLAQKLVTPLGDEFIVSLAAYRMPGKIKNAGAYVYRFWTDPAFRLVSTCYRYNPVAVLHLPSEKTLGIPRLCDGYYLNGRQPDKETVWRICRVNCVPIKDKIRFALKNLGKGVE